MQILQFPSLKYQGSCHAVLLILEPDVCVEREESLFPTFREFQTGMLALSEFVRCKRTDKESTSMEWEKSTVALERISGQRHL